MALARIITRSQTCSRELALVLLARGYAVEIVSPDKVPDNIADLELRVDAGSANELLANVETHDGERTTSLEFVHHLRAPLVDFERRPLERRLSEVSQAAHTSGAAAGFNATPDIEDLGPSVEAPRPILRADSPAPMTLSHREPNPKEGARLTAPQALLPREETPGHFAVADAAVPLPALIKRTTSRRTTIQSPVLQRTIVPAKQASQPRNRSTGWPWRAGLAFGALVLLALVPGVGMRPGRKAAAQSSEALSIKGIGAPTGVNSSALDAEKDLAQDPAQVSAVTWGLSAADSETNSTRAPKEAQVAKSGTPTTKPKSAASRKRGEDLIARDTTIYFDKRFEPAPKIKRAKPAAPGGVIGANPTNYPDKPTQF